MSLGLVGLDPALAQVPLGGGAGLLEMSPLRLREEGLAAVAKPELKSRVAVLLAGFLLDHYIGAGFEDSDGDCFTGVIEDARHADLPAQQLDCHGSVSSPEAAKTIAAAAWFESPTQGASDCARTRGRSTIGAPNPHVDYTGRRPAGSRPRPRWGEFRRHRAHGGPGAAAPSGSLDEGRCRTAASEHGPSGHFPGLDDVHDGPRAGRARNLRLHPEAAGRVPGPLRERHGPHGPIALRAGLPGRLPGAGTWDAGDPPTGARRRASGDGLRRAGFCGYRREVRERPGPLPTDRRSRRSVDASVALGEQHSRRLPRARRLDPARAHREQDPFQSRGPARPGRGRRRPTPRSRGDRVLRERYGRTPLLARPRSRVAAPRRERGLAPPRHHRVGVREARWCLRRDPPGVRRGCALRGRLRSRHGRSGALRGPTESPPRGVWPADAPGPRGIRKLATRPEAARRRRANATGLRRTGCVPARTGSCRASREPGAIRGIQLGPYPGLLGGGEHPARRLDQPRWTRSPGLRQAGRLREDPRPGDRVPAVVEASER